MVEIKKLPPGEAFGARDLQNWAHRRMKEQWGVFDKKGFRKQGKRAKILSKRAGHKVESFATSTTAHKPDAADRFIAAATSASQSAKKSEPISNRQQRKAERRRRRRQRVIITETARKKNPQPA